MKIIDQAIKLAVDEYKKEHGDDRWMEDGDAFATVFNDGVLIMSMEEKTLKIKILAGEPYKVDFNLELLSK
jgi:hypothetical protein